MADAASRAQRAAALEEKRRKLDELKKKRAMRAGAVTEQRTSGNLDEYIDGLLQQSAPPAALQPSAAPATSPAEATTTAEAPKDAKSNDVPAPPPAPAAPAPPPPPKVETFTVGIQTEPWEDDTETEETPAITPAPTDKFGTREETKKEEPVDHEPALLSEEQVATEVTRPDFGAFLTTASKKVERILGSSEYQQTLLWDVGTAPESTDDTSAAASSLVTGKQVYEAGKWTAHRDVTDLCWSSHHRDVFLAAYHAPSTPYSMTTIMHRKVDSSMLTPRSGELQADGLVLLWSLSMPHRPEHVLTCASPVLKVRQSSTPHMVLGGCASGQVVVWDVRAGGRYPVQTSALSSSTSSKQSQQGHVHPICGMEITDGGAGLVTSSLDGRLNFWSMSNLREPVESIQVPGGSISCFGVAPESESLVLGDEQGSLFTVTASAAASANKKKTSMRRKQVRKLESAPSGDADNEKSETTTNGHYGMVTAVATRPRIQTSTGLAKGFCRGSAGLVLTAGVDWTTQLWAPAYKDTPLLSWTSHSYDSISDVQWNPHNPGIFATASSNGTVGLWNLAQSFDESLTDGLVVSASEEVEGLTKLCWSNPDGRRLAVAGGGGRVHVLTLADEVVRPKGDEDAKIVQQLVARGFLSRP